MVKVPSGEVNVLRSAGMSQLTTPFAWLCFAEVSVSDWVVPPVGVNENVISNAVGTNTAVLPITWAGVNSPLPFTDTSTCWPPQVAVIMVLFLALVGSADADWATTATDAQISAAMNARLNNWPLLCRVVPERRRTPGSVNQVPPRPKACISSRDWVLWNAGFLTDARRRSPAGWRSVA